MNTPCHNCKDRHYKCHSECKKYQGYNAMREIIRKQKRKQADGRVFWYDLHEALRRREEANAKKSGRRYK